MKIADLPGQADRIAAVPTHVPGYVREFEEMTEEAAQPHEPAFSLDDISAPIAWDRSGTGVRWTGD